MCLKNDDSVMKNNLYIQYKYFCDSKINIIIESVDSISRDERDVPLTQYITNA